METEALTEEEAKTARAEFAKEFWDTSSGSEMPNRSEVIKEPEPEVIKNEDQWEGINPALKVEFENLKAKATEVGALAERLKQAERRIGSVTHELSEAKKASEDARKLSEKAPTKGDLAAAASSDEEWASLRDEFPVWAKAMDSRLELERKKIAQEIGISKDVLAEIENLKKSALSEDLVNKKISEVKVEYAKDLISLQHPGWESILKTKEWNDWISAQPDDVKQKCSSMNPFDAISVLEKYTGKEPADKRGKTVAEIEAERKERLKKSETFSNDKSRQNASKTDNDMSDEEYRKKVAREFWGKT